MLPSFPASSAMAPRSVLGPEGDLLDGSEPTLDEAATLRALRMMLLTRRFDERGVSLQRQGRFGTLSPVHGQEASVVGSAISLDPARDWVVPQYRELPALLLQGLPFERFAAYFLGHPDERPDRRGSARVAGDRLRDAGRERRWQRPLRRPRRRQRGRRPGPAG